MNDLPPSCANVTLVDRFLLSITGVHSSKTVVWYRSLLSRMVAYVSDKPISKVKLDDLRAWRASLVGKSSWTTNAACRAARRVFAFAETEGLGRNVAAYLEVPEPKLCPRSGIAQTDMRAMIRAARNDPSAYALFRFFSETGCRLSGACNLTIEDVELDQQLAWVTEKGDKRRIVFYSEETAQALRLCVGERTSGPVWLMPHGKSAYPRGVARLFDKTALHAGVTKNYSPHQWRHAAAKGWLKNGASLAHVAQLLGHKDSRVTVQFYGQFANADLQQAHQKYTTWLSSED